LIAVVEPSSSTHHSITGWGAEYCHDDGSTTAINSKSTEVDDKSTCYHWEIVQHVSIMVIMYQAAVAFGHISELIQHCI